MTNKDHPLTTEIAKHRCSARDNVSEDGEGTTCQGFKRSIPVHSIYVTFLPHPSSNVVGLTWRSIVMLQAWTSSTGTKVPNVKQSGLALPHPLESTERHPSTSQ